MKPPELTIAVLRQKLARMHRRAQRAEAAALREGRLNDLLGRQLRQLTRLHCVAKTADHC